MTKGYFLCLLVIHIVVKHKVEGSQPQTDLKLEGFSIYNTPYVTTDTPTTYPVMLVAVTNQGPENLASHSENNFNLNFYLSEGGDLTNPVVQENFAVGGTDVLHLAQEIAVGETVTFVTWTSSFVEYTSDRCRTYSHLCVAVEPHEISNTYLDSNPDNDYFCLKFIAGAVSFAGQTNCPEDPGIQSYNITYPADPVYNTKHSTEIAFDLILLNYGGADLDIVVEEDILIQLYFSDHVDNPNEAGQHSIVEDDVILTYTNLSIGPWDSLTLNDVKANITAPQEDCENYNHLCVRIIIDTRASFHDDVTTNDFCLALGGDAGDMACIGCLPSVSPTLAVLWICGFAMPVIKLNVEVFWHLEYR